MVGMLKYILVVAKCLTNYSATYWKQSSESWLKWQWNGYIADSKLYSSMVPDRTSGKYQ